MDALQRAVPIPQHEIRMRGALRRQILRQGLPLAACREHIEDRVQNLADVHLAPAPTAFGWRYRRLDQRPLAVAQITRVAQTMAVDSTAVFRLPHSAPLSSDAGAKEGITTDSSDSTTLWIGSKASSMPPNRSSGPRKREFARDGGGWFSGAVGILRFARRSASGDAAPAGRQVSRAWIGWVFRPARHACTMQDNAPALAPLDQCRTTSGLGCTTD